MRAIMCSTDQGTLQTKGCQQKIVASWDCLGDPRILYSIWYSRGNPPKQNSVGNLGLRFLTLASCFRAQCATLCGPPAGIIFVWCACGGSFCFKGGKSSARFPMQKLHKDTITQHNYMPEMLLYAPLFFKSFLACSSQPPFVVDLVGPKQSSPVQRSKEQPRPKEALQLQATFPRLSVYSKLGWFHHLFKFKVQGQCYTGLDKGEERIPYMPSKKVALPSLS